MTVAIDEENLDREQQERMVRLASFSAELRSLKTVGETLRAHAKQGETYTEQMLAAIQRAEQIIGTHRIEAHDPNLFERQVAQELRHAYMELHLLAHAKAEELRHESS